MTGLDPLCKASKVVDSGIAERDAGVEVMAGAEEKRDETGAPGNGATPEVLCNVDGSTILDDWYCTWFY